MLLRVVAYLAIANICCGFERDEKFINNENETIVSIFTRSMRISDYKVPDVDNLGEKLCKICEEKRLIKLFFQNLLTL